VKSFGTEECSPPSEVQGWHGRILACEQAPPGSPHTYKLCPRLPTFSSDLKEVRGRVHEQQK